MDEIQSLRLYLVSEYLKKFPGMFDEYEEAYILACAKGHDSQFELAPDLVREVYDELGILSIEKNIYLGFIKMIDDIFGIKDKNILEIGGGILPRLGERISKIQDKGTITVYDPRISEYKDDSSNLKLVRKTFDGTINVNNIDLMIGLMPCKAAETIVNVSTKNDIDFIIALCEGGPHGDEFDFFEDDEEWRSSLITYAGRLVEDKNMGELKIKYMKEYSNPYPIIYNDREKVYKK